MIKKQDIRSQKTNNWDDIIWQNIIRFGPLLVLIGVFLLHFVLPLFVEAAVQQNSCLAWLEMSPGVNNHQEKQQHYSRWSRTADADTFQVIHFTKFKQQEWRYRGAKSENKTWSEFWLLLQTFSAHSITSISEH